MASLEHVTEMLQRAKFGPVCTQGEWDRRVVPTTVAQILKKHGLQKTFNKDTPVNQDLELADRYFEAGLDLAATIGLLCTDTETIIKVTREEILQAISDAPSKLPLGEGSEQIVLKARKPEDKDPPIYASTLAIAVTEDLYVPLVSGIIKNKNVRMLCGPSIDTIFGIPCYGGTPYESIAGLIENRLREEAKWRAGRLGIAGLSISSATTEFGQLAAFPGQTTQSNRAIAICLQPSELKTNYTNFHKVVSAIGYDSYIGAGCPSMIGGYSGPVEGSTIANIATDLLQFAVNQTHITRCSIYDLRSESSVGRLGLWAMSVALQALSRNTHCLSDKIINQKAGPCTEEILYTNAAGLITQAVSGISMTLGPRSAGGAHKDYMSPLESWWCADLFNATGGLTLEKANELVLHALSKYEDHILQMPKGKSFTECTDLKTGKPSDEWQFIYDKAKEDFREQGLIF